MTYFVEGLARFDVVNGQLVYDHYLILPGIRRHLQNVALNENDYTETNVTDMADSIVDAVEAALADIFGL